MVNSRAFPNSQCRLKPILTGSLTSATWNDNQIFQND